MSLETCSWITASLFKSQFLQDWICTHSTQKQPGKIHYSSLNTTHSACNLGFVFDEHIAFSHQQISVLSKFCCYHIWQLCCVGAYLSSSTACTVASSIVHSELNYCNSLYYNLPKSQITHLQQIQNFFALAVVKVPKSCHIIPVLHSLHWLRVTECIKYKLLTLTYEVLTTIQPPYMHNLIAVQPSLVFIVLQSRSDSCWIHGYVVLTTFLHRLLFSSCHSHSATNIILLCISDRS